MRKLHAALLAAGGAALFALTLAVGAFTVGHASGTSRPLLVGYGCEGTTGPIYAAEEDEFPPCRAIERNSR